MGVILPGKNAGLLCRESVAYSDLLIPLVGPPVLLGSSAPPSPHGRVAVRTPLLVLVRLDNVVPQYDQRADTTANRPPVGPDPLAAAPASVRAVRASYLQGGRDLRKFLETLAKSSRFSIQSSPDSHRVTASRILFSKTCSMLFRFVVNLT